MLELIKSLIRTWHAPSRGVFREQRNKFTNRENLMFFMGGGGREARSVLLAQYHAAYPSILLRKVHTENRWRVIKNILYRTKFDGLTVYDFLIHQPTDVSGLVYESIFRSNGSTWISIYISVGGPSCA